MTPIVIVSGCPGSGKTTLSESLARSFPQGLHLVSDVFYGFPASPIDPTATESQHQNTVIMRALGCAARAFAEGGYQVVLDGVIGPWFLPTLAEEIGDAVSVAYVVLQVSEAEALGRVRERQGPGASATVSHMVRASTELGTLQSHAVDTADRSPDEIFEAVQRGLSEGQFHLRA
jgi:predicted kinase